MKPSQTSPLPSISVVIPCYRVRDQIVETVRKIPEFVRWIIVVDDACPDDSGKTLQAQTGDPRLQIIFHTTNQGVGGAMVTGYQRALELGTEIAIKLDGDGQMDPALIPRFIRPILEGRADYTKGNRFFRLESLAGMPRLRLFGNAVLSFASKISSGYWNIMDPTNGYTAIHRSALSLLPMEKLDRRYFFESDLLFRLNTVRAVIQDVPMNSLYGDEKSNLRIGKVAFEFPWKYFRSFVKRIFYSYFLRDFNIASIEMILGTVLLAFGLVYGSYHLAKAIQTALPSPSGVVMLAALPIILGIQFLLSALNYDISTQPSIALQSLMGKDDLPPISS